MVSVQLDHHPTLTSLVEAAREVGLAGIIDILLMAVFIYVALAWLRRSQASKVVQGILITGLFYLIARQFNLFLTSAVLEALFAVALVALIVIFRNELRRIFERVARWRPAQSFGRKKIAASLSPLVDMLTRTLADLARERVGALVVLTCRESIDLHLDGGVRLNGEPSEALLKSLFDVHSIGHDGAVVIEDGLLTRFACHLPLSTSFETLGSMGTRHAAALGLAERSDALCIVVSEERGAISVAKDGQLRHLQGPEQLAPLLASFLKETPAAPRPLKEAFSKDYRTKIVAIALSMLLWLVLVYGAKQSTRRLTLPVTVTEVASGTNAIVQPREITVILVGPRRNFYFFDKSSVQITLSVGEMRAGTRFKTIHMSDVTFPRDLTLRDIRPSRVRVSLQRTTSEDDGFHRPSGQKRAADVKSRQAQDAQSGDPSTLDQ